MISAQEFYGGMAETFRELSGYRPDDGTDLALRMRALAEALHGLSYQAGWQYAQSFPQTASGENLDRHAAMRGISRLPAVRAEGRIIFYREEAAAADIWIPAGTECSSAGGERYVTTEDGTLRAGQTAVSAPACAADGGRAGNCSAGVVRHMNAPVPGIGWCEGGEFTGGADAEGDEALRARILASYARLPNGANAAWYETRARDIPGVAAAAVFPRARGRGTVDVVVSSQEGMPDEALLGAVTEAIGAAREIAVDVEVRPPKEIAVDVEIEITPAPGRGESAVREVGDALRACFGGGRLGKDVLAAELGWAVYSTGAVKNYRLISPAADIPVPAGELPVARSVSVYEV